jgi:hypothetical protein
MDGAWGDCDNDVDVRSGEIGGQGGKTIEVTIREAILELNVPPFQVPEFPHCLAERRMPGFRRWRRLEPANAPNFAQRLCAGGERHGQNNSRQNGHQDRDRLSQSPPQESFPNSMCPFGSLSSLTPLVCPTTALSRRRSRSAEAAG